MLARGRDAEAEDIIRNAARINKVQLPEKVFDKNTFEEASQREKLWHIFTSPVLAIRTGILCLNWSVGVVVVVMVVVVVVVVSVGGGGGGGAAAAEGAAATAAAAAAAVVAAVVVVVVAVGGGGGAAAEGAAVALLVVVVVIVVTVVVVIAAAESALSGRVQSAVCSMVFYGLNIKPRLIPSV